jgi:tetratricopeptide (TPR) repeat protein
VAGFLGRHTHIVVMLLLLGLVAVVYAQTRRFEFVSFDDGLYIFDNPHVTAGLSGDSLSWSLSFEAKQKTYWHPLTWLTHMLDVELFGLDAGAHHLTNAALHLANAWLLFAVLFRATGARLPSLFAAALFAVHPVNVESVAWVAERKNVLSTAFWLLTTLLYVHYARRPGMRRYALMMGAFLLGLLAKPMLVTLPCTLLLLDFWPLGRLKFKAPRASETEAAADGAAHFPAVAVRDLIFEKIPMLVLSLLVVHLALGSLRQTDITVSFAAIPLAARIENALASYVVYLVKAFWPGDLAMFYPYRLNIPLWETVCAALLLAAVTFFALRAMRSRPYVTMGWLWFAGTLVPVSGLVQAGLWPAWADRWAYIPHIGLFIAVAWTLEGVFRRRRAALQAGVAAAAAVAVGLLAHAGNRQAAVWENSVRLYRHAVAVVPNNFIAYNNLGSDLYSQGLREEAREAYREALRANPYFPYPYYNLGRFHLDRGETDLAAEYLEMALALDGNLGSAHTLMGEISQRRGELHQALSHYQQALKADPENKKALNDLAVILIQAGKTEGAINSLRAALKVDPQFAEAHNNLGYAYLLVGQPDAAAGHLEKALALDPGNEMAQANLREALGSRGRP